MQNSNIIVPAIQNPELLVEENLRQIIAESKRLAADAARRAAAREGGDYDSWGFTWVEIHGIKGNTRLGRMLKKVGVRQGYNRAFHIWNPSGLSVHSISIRGAGAEVCANYLKSKGFDACVCSRIIDIEILEENENEELKMNKSV